MSCGCGRRAKSVATKLGYEMIYWHPKTGHYVTADELVHQHTKKTAEIVLNSLRIRRGKHIDSTSVEGYVGA